MRPDCILMDLHMPEMDGFEATRILKSDANTSSIPIIALTGGVSEEEKMEAEQAGVNGFASKPFTKETLIAMIYNCVRRNGELC